MAAYCVVQRLLFVGLLVTGAWVLFRLLKFMGATYVILRDYFVLWHVAFGAHPGRRGMGRMMRQHAYVCATHLLDNVSVKELYDFCKSMMQSDMSVENFHKVVRSYTFAVFCRERIDGSLRGIYLLGKEYKEANKQKYTVIKLGLALVRSEYRGGPLMYYVFLWHAIKELVYHPRTPVYVMGKAFSYLSYITLLHYLKDSYPRYDRETPALERTLLNDFANSVKTSDETYNPDTFVLEREKSNLKSSVAHISERDLEDPNIQFFAKTNPGWNRGHCMFFIAKITWRDVANILWKAVKRARRGRKANPGPKPKSKLSSRSMSFQEETANQYVFQHCEVDAMGNLLHKRDDHHSFITTVKEEEEEDEYKEITLDQ